MKPILKYRGGKSKEINELLPHFPKYTGRYIEPFFGGGAMFFHIEPKNAIINDINSRLMNFYETVSNNYQELRNELNQIEAIYSKNRAEFEKNKSKKPNERVEDKNELLYYKLRDMYNGIVQSNYLDATLYFYINKTSYSGMIRYNAHGDFNVPYGRYKNFNTHILTDDHHELLSQTMIMNGDYKEVFNQTRPNDFVFLDPPYDCIFSDYGNEEYRDGFNEQSHRQLAQDFFNLPCQSIMVIGGTKLTRELYANNIIGEYAKNYSVNIRNRFQAGAMHIIVSNF